MESVVVIDVNGMVLKGVLMVRLRGTSVELKSTRKEQC
jgi:hypothetical protein